jgi:hypothetical protein
MDLNDSDALLNTPRYVSVCITFKRIVGTHFYFRAHRSLAAIDLTLQSGSDRLVISLVIGIP